MKTVDGRDNPIARTNTIPVFLTESCLSEVSA